MQCVLAPFLCVGKKDYVRWLIHTKSMSSVVFTVSTGGYSTQPGFITTGKVNSGFAVTLGFPFQNDHGMLVTIATYALKQTWSEQVLCRLGLEHNPLWGV